MLIAVRAQAMPEAKERLAAVNILNVPAPAAMFGKMEAVLRLLQESVQELQKRVNRGYLV